MRRPGDVQRAQGLPVDRYGDEVTGHCGADVVPGAVEAEVEGNSPQRGVAPHIVLWTFLVAVVDVELLEACWVPRSLGGAQDEEVSVPPLLRGADDPAGGPLDHLGLECHRAVAPASA